MSDKRAAEGVGPYGCKAVGSGANLRDVEDAVPYGRVRSREVAANLRDVEDAVPYGMVQKTGVMRKPREGQAPPLRGGAKPWG